MGIYAVKHYRPTTSSKLLPDSHKGTSTSAANQQVEREIAHQDKKRRKYGKYHHYDAEIRAKIAKHACECGIKRAAIKFTQELGHPINESSVRNMKKAYLQKADKYSKPR